MTDHRLPWDSDWILDEQILAIRLPDREDIEQLARLGITLVVTVVSESYADPIAGWCKSFGVRSERYLVDDMAAPEMDQIRSFVAETRAELERGGKVAVHCLGGIGRTGTMIACFLVSEGEEARAAIRAVRHRRSGSIQTVSQEIAIVRYAAEIREDPA